jgi:hypothetical protein
LGTVAYMSPEQVLENVLSGLFLTVDVHSEIWRIIRSVKRTSPPRRGNPPARTNPPGRMMDWEVISGQVVYSCTHCAWKLSLISDERAEPHCKFDEHDCTEYPKPPDRPT